jgi:hypothetical protein
LSERAESERQFPQIDFCDAAGDAFNRHFGQRVRLVAEEGT